MFHTKVAQKFKTRIFCSINFFFFESLVVLSDIVEKDVERDRPQMTIWHMPIACWTHMFTLTPLNATLYVHCLYCC